MSNTLLYTLQIDVGSRSHPYLLYALTVSGVAYLLRLGPISNYVSRSGFRLDELAEFNVNAYGPVTSAAAIPSGCLVLGRGDGSLACLQLGSLDPSAPGIIKFSCPLFLTCVPLLPLIYLKHSFLQLHQSSGFSFDNLTLS